MLQWLICLGFVLTGAAVHAQPQTDSAMVQRVVGVHLRYGSTVVHTKAIQNISGANPAGFEVEIAKIKTSYSHWNMAGSFTKTGFMAGYYDFNNAIIGHGVVLSYFIEPTYRFTKKITGYYRAGIGLDYLSNPYHIEKNPANKNYSQHINPYMHLNAGLGFSVSKHVALAAEASFHHTSNGEFTEPNKGVNWATVSVGVRYTPGNNLLPVYTRNRRLNRTSRKLYTDIGLMLMPPQDYKTKTNARRTIMAGFLLQATKPISNRNGITAGAEIYYSHYQKRAGSSIVNDTDPIMVGIHGGHVFLLGKVSFSQQFGFHIIKPAKFILTAYQKYLLGYQLSAQTQLGIGLQANADNADFTHIYFMYRF